MAIKEEPDTATTDASFCPHCGEPVGGSQFCPSCGRKGLHFSDHPHAFGHKDFSHVECRFCHTRFKRKEQRSLTAT